jgi:hypothetical protein
LVRALPFYRSSASHIANISIEQGLISPTTS